MAPPETPCPKDLTPDIGARCWYYRTIDRGSDANTAELTEHVSPRHGISVAMVIGWRDRWPYPVGVPQADSEGAGAARAGRRHEEMVAMMFWDSGWAWWQAGLMWLAMIAFWALLIWLIYALVTGAVGRGRQPERDEERPGDDARRILDERLARGEIKIEEYQRLRDVIEGSAASRTGAGSGQ